MTINQRLIVMGLGMVLVAGTLGFDWADTLFRSADAHGVQEQLQSRFVRIEDETFNTQSMQTGEILTIQGRLVSVVDRDLRGWVSIFSESENAGDRWEIVGRDPPGSDFDIAGNSAVPYTVSARALEEGVYHVHTQLNVASVGPGIGPGATVVVEGEPIARPAPPDSTAAAMLPGGAPDGIPVVQIDPEAEAAALARGYDLRRIANVSGLLPDLVATHEILACEPGVTYISALYVPHPIDPELPDGVALVIQLYDSNVLVGTTVPLLEAIFSNTTLDMIQGWAESAEFAEEIGVTGEFDVTHWSTDTLDAAGLGDDAFSYTVGISVEGQEYRVQQIWFSRDRLVIFVATTGLGEDAMAVAAELDARAAQMVQPDAPTTTTPTCEAIDYPDDIPMAAAVPVAGIGPYAYLRGADLAGAHLQGATLFSADLAGAHLQHANLTGASLINADLAGAHLQAANLTGASLINADLAGAHLRYSYLPYADLRGADLAGAHLQGASLEGAHLQHANLTGAHLTGAHLQGASLLNADLAGAHLQHATLSNADLRGAILVLADLTGANLGGADLKRTDLAFANLTGASLEGAHLRDADLISADLTGANLGGADLAGAHLQYARLPNDVFQGADLQGADLSGADLEGADLQGADLPGANLPWAYLPGANLRDADLSGANLFDADLFDADLSGANLQRANLVLADLFDADLSGANLQRANLVLADLSAADLRGADLTGANLTGADLEGAYLFDADLRGADLSGAHVSDVEYRGGISYSHGPGLSGANLWYAYLRGANLSGADLSGAQLFDANLPLADLSGADLTAAIIVKIDLSGADLRGADLTGAAIIETDLSGADLRGADLSGANLQNSNLTGADLRGADLTGTVGTEDFTGALACDTAPLPGATLLPCP